MLGLSSYPYNQLITQKSSIDARARTAVQKAVKEEQNSAILKADLSKSNLEAQTTNKLLVTTFQEFIYGIRGIASSKNIEVTGLSPKDGRTMNGNARELSAVAVPLLYAPSVKVVTLDVRGKFKSVDDLQEFLDFLRTQNMAIGGLKINRDTFVATIDMYGV